MSNQPLDGLHVLVLEDEFLIAMDLEQLCRDHGAANVAICQNLASAEASLEQAGIDAAIVDLQLAGVSTLDFADSMTARGVPFIFATGFGQTEEMLARFPHVPVVSKPYMGDELIEALASAIAGKQQKQAC